MYICLGCCGRGPNPARKFPERLGRRSLSLNQILEDKWNVVRHRRKGKLWQAEVMTCFSTEVWEDMAYSGKCQLFSVGGREGEWEDSDDERRVRKTMDFILGVGESHQRIINRDNRGSVLESLGSCLEEKWRWEKEWLLSSFVSPQGKFIATIPVEQGDEVERSELMERFLNLPCPIQQHQLWGPEAWPGWLSWKIYCILIFKNLKSHTHG